MKNNYPIKYAVMPIIRQTGWVSGMNELEREYADVAYIASKCYLVKENKKYKANGEKEILYEVVFPYRDGNYGYWCRVEPEYNLSNCINSNLLDKVYDTYEEAQKAAKEKNNELLAKQTWYIAFNSKYKKEYNQITKEYKERLAVFKNLEKLIEEKTGDLVVDEQIKEQSVIIYSDNKKKKLLENIYFVINLWSDNNFCVYGLTSEEYEQIAKDIKDGKPIDKYMKKSLMVNDPASKTIKISNPNNSSDCAYLSSNTLTFVRDKNLSEKNFDSSNSKIIFFTLETYEDIIKSFVTKYMDNDELKLSNIVIARRLKI
jgi:hypothetical protein